MKFTLWLGRFALAIGLLGLASGANATGNVDGSFNGNGYVHLVGLQAYGPNSTIVLPNGHIAYAVNRPGNKDVLIGMRNADGTEDGNFANGGLISITSPTAGGTVSSPYLAYDVDNKRLVMAATDTHGGYHLMLCRFLLTGQLDTGFTLTNYPGVSGCISTSPPGAGTSGLLASGVFTYNGSIFAGGNAFNVSGTPFFKPFLAVAQSGTIDVAVRIDSTYPNLMNVTAVANDPNSGFTYMTGTATLGTETNPDVAIVVMRGKLDGQWGYNFFNVNLVSLGYDEGRGVAVRPDGNVVIAGVVDEASPVYNDCYVLTVDPNLQPLSGWGQNNGRFFTTFAGGNDDGGRCDAVTVDSQNRTYIGGTVSRFSNSDRDMVVARLTASGQLDPSFGGNTGAGITTIDPNDSFSTTVDERVSTVALQNGRVVFSGSWAPMSGATAANTDLAISRLDNSDLIFTTSNE